MHHNASKLMNQKTSVCDFAKRVLREQNPGAETIEVEKLIRNKNRVWISQYDMALIQFSFVGAALLEPKSSGLHGISKQGLEDVIYTWKVICYKIGISGKYSIFEEVDYEMVYALCKLIWEQEYLPHMVRIAC